jgi:hypothetical protein
VFVHELHILLLTPRASLSACVTAVGRLVCHGDEQNTFGQLLQALLVLRTDSNLLLTGGEYAQNVAMVMP